MAEATPKRLLQAAKDLNIGIDRAVETLAREGIVVENRPTTKLTGEQVALLERKIAASVGDKQEELRHTQARRQNGLNAQAQAAATKPILAELAVVAMPPTPPPVAVVPMAPAASKIETPRLKVFGKIELDEKGRVIPPRPAALPTATPASTAGLKLLGKIELDDSTERILPSPPASTAATYEQLAAHREAEDVLGAVVQSQNSGGYLVEILGHVAFLPGSHDDVNLKAVPAGSALRVGSSIQVVILEIKPDKQQVIVSRYKARQAQHQQRLQEFQRLSPGTVLKAVVNYHTPHYSALRAGALKLRVAHNEWSWDLTPPPDPGTVVEVAVTEIDAEKLQVRASRRLLLPDPWIKAPQSYVLGTEVTGCVIKIVSFGIFLEIEPGLSALLHRAHLHSLDPTQLDLTANFQAGDQVPVIVNLLEPEGRKMGVALALPLQQWQLLRTVQDELRQQQQLVHQFGLDRVTLSDQLARAEATHVEAAYALALKLSQEVEQANQLRASYSSQVATLTREKQTLQAEVAKFRTEHAKAEASLKAVSSQQQLTNNKVAQLTQQIEEAQQQLAQSARQVLTTSPSATDSQAFNDTFCVSSSKAGFPFHCLIHYLPTRVTGTTAQQQDRQFVFSFKDGKNATYTAFRLAVALLRCFRLGELQQMVLVPIPASSREKTRLRYEDFCQQLCAHTGLVNGYGAISRIQDQEAQKGQSNVDKISNLRYNQNQYIGKHILLFDDVMTTGASFTQNATALREHGARQITGLFLARTMNTWNL